LEHELWDDSVELGALEAERLSLLAHTLLASAECTEVLDCLWNSSSLFFINLNNKGLRRKENIELKKKPIQRFVPSAKCTFFHGSKASKPKANAGGCYC